MTEEIFDVVMQSTGSFRADFDEFLRARPPEGNFELGSDLWVGGLPHGIRSNLVFDACSPAGYNFNPVRQYGCRYAICRRVQPRQSDHYEWDSDGWLLRVLFLSRLIRPTTIGTNLSAKLYFRDGELQMIVPGPTSGFGTNAWVVEDSKWRDWLSVTEFEQLRDAIPKYFLSPPDRVRQARKHIDHAFHTFYLDQRCASVVTGFEGLLKTSPYKSTKQFAARAPRLADRVGLELTEEESIALYDDRSAFVHGTQVSFTDVNDELIVQYNRFEQVLRRSLLQASTDSSFAALFSSDQSVEDAFGK
jgi:hypothetical protein